MAMTASIFSISALSVELGLDRRTVTAGLKDTPPDGTDARGYPGWRLRTALASLGYQRIGQRNSGDASYETSRERWMRARAARAELELRERRGELTEVAPLLQEVQQRWCNIVLQVRTRFLGLPSRLAARHAALKTPQSTFEVSMKIVREVLNVLAANAD